MEWAWRQTNPCGLVADRKMDTQGIDDTRSAPVIAEEEVVHVTQLALVLVLVKVAAQAREPNHL
jgi:hypothetical protein